MTKLELFKIYDKENPAMWDLFKKFADRLWIRNGRKVKE